MKKNYDTDPSPQKSVKTSGRYRKVEVRTWGDEKFRGLSPIPPCGQGLWLFLITGPHTGPIPGLFRAGRAAMAEELDWEPEAFAEAFQEVSAKGMVKADFKARVMWVPNAIKHNKPESPNVVKSWASEFDLIPECELKREAFDSLKASIHALGESFAKAFDEAFGKPYAKAYPKTMPNQEQEQEQEQELIPAANAALSKPADAEFDLEQSDREESGKPKLPDCPYSRLLELWRKHLPHLAQPRAWEGNRRQSMRARWQQAAKPSDYSPKGYSTEAEGIAWWSSFFSYIANDTRLSAGFESNGRTWRPDLEWVCNSANFQKIIDGKYES